MTAERKGPMIFGIPGTDDASAAAAVSRMGGFTERDKDIALEMATAELEAADAAAEPEAEEAEPDPEPKPERFRLDEETTTPMLSKAAPMDNAKAFARNRLRKDGTLATYYYHGDWWQWNGRFYETAPADRIAGNVYDYLDRARVRTGEGDERFRPKPENADALIKCLKACVGVDDRDGLHDGSTLVRSPQRTCWSFRIVS